MPTGMYRGAKACTTSMPVIPDSNRRMMCTRCSHVRPRRLPSVVWYTIRLSAAEHSSISAPLMQNRRWGGETRGRMRCANSLSSAFCQIAVLPLDAHYQQHCINAVRQALRILTTTLHDGFPQQPCQNRQGIHACDALQLSHQYDGDSGPLPVNLDTTDGLEQHRLHIRLQQVAAFSQTASLVC